MTEDEREEPTATGDPASDVPGILEDGLAAGFGPPPRAEEGPAPSVLERLAHTTGLRPRVSLREEPSRTPSRVLKPLGLGAPGWRSIEGKYQVQGEIARGGVGVVLKGHDVDLGRDVAMKVLHDKYLDNPDLMQRFVEEAQIGGQLQHPGIVPVYELGLSGERPYFTMKLIKGRTLAALFEELTGGEAGAGRRRLLGIFEQVCQTMAYAHARGVIHRDLKPANVMVGAFGEVQVVDWGMGKVLSAGGIADEERSHGKNAPSVIETVRSQPGSGSSQSIVGSVMGTPAYMPPEQANGDVERMDERSDVFALGAILCEILTGAPPYVGSPSERIAMAAKARLEPCRERLAACGADEALRELCTDCLRPAPAVRPRNAGIVAERIASYLAEVEERAHAAQIRAAAENARAGAARRSQRLTLALAASVLVTVIGGAGGAWWIERAARARQEAAVLRVTSALDDVGRLLGEAHAAVGADLAPWDRVAEAADQAVKLAAVEDVPENRRREAREMRGRIERERARAELEAGERMREARLVETLGRIRVPPDEGIRGDDWPRRDAERRDREYEAAFADYFEGRSIEDLGPEEAAGTLSASENRLVLAAALDHWALVRDLLSAAGDPDAADGSDLLREIADRVDDGDPWRSELRFLLGLDEDPAALTRLADQTDLTALPEASIALLGEALWSVGAEDEALEVYRRGRELHPEDFGICMRLAIMLWRLEEQPREEILEVLRVANALQPDVREVQHLRIIALHSLGRYEEERRICEILLGREPKHMDWLQHYYWALDPLYEWTEMVEACRRRIAAVEGESEIASNQLAGSYQNLTKALERQGRLDEALEAYRKGYEVVEQYRGRLGADPLAGNQFILESGKSFAEGLERLERRSELEAILDGERRARSIAEWLEAASFATRTGRYELAAETYGLVFLDHPEVESEYTERYAAARAAALCGTGRGRDAGLLDDARRAEWRRQASAWLRAELAAQRELAQGGAGGVADRLDGWRREPDLSGIRDESALAALPRVERHQCREFWAELEVFLADLRDGS